MRPLDRDAIVAGAADLPAFPRVIQELLAALDDDNASLATLARHIARDPVLTGRVLAAANQLLRHEGRPAVKDVYTAASLIGMTRIRHTVLTTSIAAFTRNLRGKAYFWEHSLAVGIGAQELARHTGLSLDHALVAGLLHDIGQLWMSYFHPEEFTAVRRLVEEERVPVCEAEKRHFSLDHCEIGGIIAEHWELPPEIATAIVAHHAPEPYASSEKLAAITHIAELISNALDLPYREVNRVAHVSSLASAVLGIDWNADQTPLFGAISARYRYAATLFA